MFLDFSPEVVAFSSQPFWLTWRDERSRKHAPDFFARMADGTGLLIDVRPDDRIDENDAEVLALTRRACEAVGRSYQRIGALEPVLAANLGSPWEKGTVETSFNSVETLFAQYVACRARGRRHGFPIRTLRGRPGRHHHPPLNPPPGVGFHGSPPRRPSIPPVY
jgi:hypothetical protein